MTSEELIPILKALHADPTCAPIMADWFEERDDLETAIKLRDWKWSSGKHLVWFLTTGGRRGGQDIYPRHWKCRKAVMDEAWSRVVIDEPELIRLFDQVRWHNAVRQILLGVPRDRVQYIPHGEHWPTDRTTRYTFVSDDGERTARSYLTPLWVEWEPDVTVFYGDDWLRCQMCVWVGRDPLNHRTIMTHPCKSLCRDIRIVEMPF
jgi:hypothetical protein